MVCIILAILVEVSSRDKCGSGGGSGGGDGERLAYGSL